MAGSPLLCVTFQVWAGTSFFSLKSRIVPSQSNPVAQRVGTHHHLHTTTRNRTRRKKWNKVPRFIHGNNLFFLFVCPITRGREREREKKLLQHVTTHTCVCVLRGKDNRAFCCTDQTNRIIVSFSLNSISLSSLSQVRPILNQR
jgi:hypothetical protein